NRIGIYLTTGSHLIRSNTISGNTADGIVLIGSRSNTISGNFIGTRATGTGTIPNQRGIVLDFGARDNVIGGPASARNLISGNEVGVFIRDGSTSVVSGNWIGLDANGAALRNLVGVEIAGGASNVIGG